MDSTFASMVELLQPKFRQLIEMAPVHPKSIKGRDIRRGVYLFSEGGDHQYIGRSNHIRRRYSKHCDPGSPVTSASFAVKLARIQTNKMATYRAGDGDLASLLLDPLFMTAFVEAKSRIRGMEFRFVEEDEPNQQALLEIYCTIVLKTPYNDFDNH